MDSNWRRAKAILNSAAVDERPVLSSREMVAAGTPLRRASSFCVQLTRCRSVRSQPRSCASASAGEVREMESRETGIGVV